MNYKLSFNLFIFLMALLLGCNVGKNVAVEKIEISSLRYVNHYIIPYNLNFKNTTVGGLSGIDYDKTNDQYYIISDDRNAINKARFYSAKINFSNKGIDTVIFTNVFPLQEENKNVLKDNPDPESIRYLPGKNLWVWSSEGERIVSAKDTVLNNPSINLINAEGKLLNNFTVPENFKMHATEYGSRRNGVWEGLSFSSNFKNLWVSTEEPLYQDGPRADVFPNDAYTRIIKYDVKTKKPVAQYAYLLEPVAHAPIPANAFKVNGISEILAVGNDKLLIMERSFSTGNLNCTVRVFEVDFKAATNIGEKSILEIKDFKAATKKLLLNMDDLGIYIDNVEGLCFGPTLANGKQSLIFIADNNFNPLEQQQVFLFEVN